MPWQEVTKMLSKKEFVRLAMEGRQSFSDLCERFTISRNTGYKLLKRYQEVGEAGLESYSRRPHRSPSKTTEQVEKRVLEVREENPTWGGRKIRAWLLNAGEKNVPASSTITDILYRYGKILETRRQADEPYKRFEHESPNDLWQMDFKGHFSMMRGRCHPLTILDDHSRFSIGLKACENQRGPTVKKHLIEIFRQYGLPLRMNMDNGVPWRACGYGKHYTELSVWLIRVGIRLSFSRFRHPQTNGKDERFHRTLKTELLQFHYFRDNAEAQKRFDKWREKYNLERPHEALKMKPPIARYQTSPRKYPEQLPAIEYLETDIVRKVDRAGEISYRNRDYFIGEALCGEYVVLRPCSEHSYDVYFCHQKLKRIDLTKAAT